jgi:hypothetical protein
MQTLISDFILNAFKTLNMNSRSAHGLLLEYSEYMKNVDLLVHTFQRAQLDTSWVSQHPCSSHLIGEFGVVLLELSWCFSEQNNDSGSNRSQANVAENESNNQSKAVVRECYG